ncbi:MAG: hypothetical protein ABFD64_09030 [Armatimonadota bacterium]
MPLSLLRQMRRINRDQWIEPDNLEAVQLHRLKRQVKRAWDYSPFYRERLSSAGFEPGDLKSIDDLRRLPVLTKSELQAAGGDAFCSDIDLDSCVWLKTSGSSGSPLSLPFTSRDKSHRVLKELRALMAHGYKFTDRMIIFVEPRCMVEKKNSLQKLGLLRRDYVSIFADQPDQLARIESIHPQVIYGYTSSLRIIAESLAHNNSSLPVPKVLMTAAELLDPATRKLLKDGFGTEPADFYGSMEFGWIGWQCQERHGYHINSDCLIVECLKDGQPAGGGEEGELVITNLYSDAAPLIRYSSGDSGVLSSEKCRCGRSLPILESLTGRLADCISLPGGRKVSPYTVTCAIEDIPGVGQFQVVQRKDWTVNISLVPSSRNLNTDDVRTAVQKMLGHDVAVVVEATSRLPLDPNGKFRVVRSYVNPLQPTAQRDISEQGCIQQ